MKRGICPDCGRPITLQLSGWWTHDGLPGDCWRQSMDGPGDEPKHSLAELESLPTLCQGQADDLKLDDGTTRIWLCRCGVEDGMPFNNAVTVEHLLDGRWTEVEQYEAQ